MRAVLFVCVENTFRSVLSEALFNATAPPGWRAESAGVQAAASINPVVPELLREIGIELGPKTPRKVTPEMTEDWPIPGATGKTREELRAIRDELRRRVADLSARLEASTVSAKSA
ncbi:MAG: hypothetical protein E6K03_06080 [Methanobacteriota archaeon]|nr:MAG: hypothetical protein E6K03_06080 [Euryarchaeota archaeon]